MRRPATVGRFRIFLETLLSLRLFRCPIKQRRMLLGFVFACIEVSQVQDAVPMFTVAIKFLKAFPGVQVVLIEVAVLLVEIQR